MKRWLDQDGNEVTQLTALDWMWIVAILSAYGLMARWLWVIMAGVV